MTAPTGHVTCELAIFSDVELETERALEQCKIGHPNDIGAVALCRWLRRLGAAADRGAHDRHRCRRRPKPGPRACIEKHEFSTSNSWTTWSYTMFVGLFATNLTRELGRTPSFSR
jgi:hypothetical protein